MGTLGIIITHYREKWEVGKMLFDSIAMQRMINFDDINVILVNDGEENELPKECFENYPYEVYQISIPHGGVSKARNAGLDASDDDWVMFCDFDDCFSSIFGLYLLFCGIKEDKYDVIWSHFTEETKDDKGNIVLVDHDLSWVFIHGKIFRRQYLLENDIRFHPKLTIHEDAFFIIIAQSMCGEGRIGSIRTPFYLWKWNDDSVVRKDCAEDYILLTYDHLMRQRIALTEEFIKRGQMEHAMNAIVKTVIDTYYDCQKSTWRVPANKELLHKAENWFAAYLKRYANYYTQANIKLIAGMAKSSRENAVKSGTFIMEAETLKDWLQHIMDTAKPIPVWEQNV